MDNNTKVDSVLTEEKSPMMFDERMAKTQMWHFLILTCLPIPLTVAAFVWFPPTLTNILEFLVMWFLTLVGVICGSHRYLSHRSFEPVKSLKQSLVALACMGGQGPPVVWAAFHRRHHQFTDKEGDPHTPNQHDSKYNGVFHAAFGWMKRHEYPNPMVYVPDLLRDEEIGAVNKHYYKWIALAMILPALAEFAITQKPIGLLTGFLWGWGVRSFVLSSTIGYINSLNHLIGTKAFQTRDNSRNHWWMTIITLGESFHNNHHAFPRSAHVGLYARNLDIGYGLIKLWQWMGLASNVQVPTPQRVESRKISKEEN
ncbi:acyl-CoA desaturase [Pseudoalteromonas fuliginea]|uniref:Acyl-CoA desaturase n=3 Tax=Pseudoalteromonas TaxID=53246 RepID=A0AB73BGY4_9GAMM|nr:acyl-CoA desaturase [Pseudoalteromonas fuliginea]